MNFKKLMKRASGLASPISGRSGFTLVELLIVIALLAAIALVVIAAINPIEQANRARDTRFNTDAGQIVSAVERYHAVNFEFPWVTVTTSLNNESPIGFLTAGDEQVGICGASCSANGVLLTSEELKSEFRNRDFVTGSSADELIQVGKAAGSNSSVYACYIPLSNATRQKACAENNVYTLGPSGERIVVTPSECSSATADWSNSGYHVCLPS